MKTKFDKVIVISYVGNSYCQNKISDKLNKLGIDFEFVYGIDAKNISNIKTIEFDDPVNKWRNDLTNNYYDDYYIHGISCCIAHLTAIELAYSKNYNNVLIIEDDVWFNDDIDKIEKYFNSIPEDADVIQYGYINFANHKNRPDYKYNELYNKIDFLNNGTQCYCICNRKTMQIYLNHIKKHFMAYDQIHWIDNFVNIYNLNVYCAINRVCIDKDHTENTDDLEIYNI